MNCNTPFHNFWKKLDVDAFIPCLLGLIVIIGILYCYAFNTQYNKLYDSADVVSYKEYNQEIPCPNGNKDCHDHSGKYAIIKYTRKSNPRIIHTSKIPIPCSNVLLYVKSDNPTTLRKYKCYNEYVGIFFTGNNSSKKMDQDLFVLE